VTTFSMMGKAAITMTASTVYTTASEVFPTEARNAGMGIVATIGAVGSMIAPYIGPPLVRNQNLLFSVSGLIRD
jgi:MFS family permease